MSDPSAATDDCLNEQQPLNRPVLLLLLRSKWAALAMARLCSAGDSRAEIRHTFLMPDSIDLTSPWAVWELAAMLRTMFTGLGLVLSLKPNGQPMDPAALNLWLKTSCFPASGSPAVFHFRVFISSSVNQSRREGREAANIPTPHLVALGGVLWLIQPPPSLPAFCFLFFRFSFFP